MLMLLASVVLTFAVSCEKHDAEPQIEYLEVNANNLSGQWELTEWNGAPLKEGTYVYLDIIRKDKKYVMYQNLDSYADVPHTVTGSFNIDTDPMLGAVIRGNYDHDSGDWAHRYIVKELTKESMLWIAKDNPEFVQRYTRIEAIPVAPAE